MTKYTHISGQRKAIPVELVEFAKLLIKHKLDWYTMRWMDDMHVLVSMPQLHAERLGRLVTHKKRPDLTEMVMFGIATRQTTKHEYAGVEYWFAGDYYGIESDVVNVKLKWRNTYETATIAAATA